MKAKKILFITQEMVPFVPETQKSIIGRYLPQAIQEKGHEIRTFTPKWGVINERRNQLHEVIRLSGMNLIIDDTDHPLIIKVSSIQAARMQIYFIDNDDYFMKREMDNDKDGVEYEDNAERAIFYARGVLETVKKLRWIPDVIYCQGWISALAPYYIKKAYADEPAFSETKVVYSVPSPELHNDYSKGFANCVAFRDATIDDIADICADKVGQNELAKIGMKYADGIILDNGSEEVDPALAEYAKTLDVPTLGSQTRETMKEAYHEFFESLIEEEG